MSFQFYPFECSLHQSMIIVSFFQHISHRISPSLAAILLAKGLLGAPHSRFVLYTYSDNGLLKLNMLLRKLLTNKH
jgi:hypothetical protein